jgi:hypothetical protein
MPDSRSEGSDSSCVQYAAETRDSGPRRPSTPDSRLGSGIPTAAEPDARAARRGRGSRARQRLPEACSRTRPTCPSEAYRAGARPGPVSALVMLVSTRIPSSRVSRALLEPRARARRAATVFFALRGRAPPPRSSRRIRLPVEHRVKPIEALPAIGVLLEERTSLPHVSNPGGRFVGSPTTSRRAVPEAQCRPITCPGTSGPPRRIADASVQRPGAVTVTATLPARP